MDTRQRPESVVDPARIMIGAFIVVAVIAGLVMRLWYLQIVRGDDFLIASERNRLREVPRPAPRGLIYDRDGSLMLTNRPFFDLVLVPQYLSEREKTISILADLFHMAPEAIEKRLENAVSLPKFAPVEIKKNLSLHEVALVESVKFFLPGVDVETKPRRAYERNESAHLLGYLDEITGRELDAYKGRFPAGEYESQSSIGKMGVEKKFESYLRGRKGIDYLQVDAHGRLQTKRNLDFGDTSAREAKRGNDLFLTLDKDVQDAALEAFKNKNGALVALDPNTGEVLAYVSNPNFSLSMFQDGLTSEDWQALQSNPFKPLLDKVTGGAYPPASTYKVMTAIAALQEDIVVPSRVYNCNGTFSLGSGKWRCWKRTGHGPVNLYQAIAMSCDVWFYQVGNLVGVDKVAKWAKLFGFGEKTGLDLNMELPGIVPSTAWKLRTRGAPWLQGDTINISIGQGYNLTTPIQLANAYAAIANGGTLYRPYVLKKIVNAAGKVVESGAPKVIRKIEIKESVLAVIHQALKDVVQSPIGTAQKIRLENVTIAGKTGTAQNAALKRTKDTENVQLLQKDHAWFAAYSPSEDPKIVVVVLSEYDGGGGSSQAAPIAREVIQAFWHKRDPVKFPYAALTTAAKGSAAAPVPPAKPQHQSSGRAGDRPSTGSGPADRKSIVVPAEAPELPQDPALYLEERVPAGQDEPQRSEREGD